MNATAWARPQAQIPGRWTQTRLTGGNASRSAKSGKAALRSATTPRSDDAEIPNAKDVVKGDDMLIEINAAYIEVLFGIWEGNANELAEAISMPVFMVAQSVESMEQVREIDEEVEREERDQKPKEIILTVLLMLLPLRGVSRNNATLKRVIEKKNALRGAALDALGEVFKRHDRSIQTIINVCRKR